MTDQMQAIRDDLAFMREMTVSDEAATARKSGVILTVAGFVFAGASVLAWATTVSLAPAWTMTWVWPASMVIFCAVLILVLSRGPQARGVRDRTLGIAWAAIGWAIFAIMAGFAVASLQLHSAQLMSGAPTVILALYGAAWTVAATLSGRLWMKGVALGGYVAAVAIGFLVTSPLIFLVYAAALLLLTAAPGVVLMRRKD
jgi:hypothetical protein